MSEKAKEDLLVEKFVKKAQKGDSEAFGFIYDVFVDRIYRYVFYRVPEEEVEDVLAEIFTRSWKNIGKYQKKKEARFSSWLFCIARNAISDFHKKKKTTLELGEKIREDESKSPIKEVEAKISFEGILQALSKVKASYRDILVMRYLDDLKYSEIANILGKKESAIRVSVMRGLNEIRRILNCNKT